MDTLPAATRHDRRSALQERVTLAITDAFFAELADVGYGHLSVDAIVRRAGVGKAAVYRRWASKKAMAIDLIARSAVQEDMVPDTGSLGGDLVALLQQLQSTLRRPLVSRIVPAVAAEAGRDAELNLVLRDTVEEPRRKSFGRMIQRAISRGELPQNCDIDLALDLVAGPMYWRLLVRRADLGVAEIERLAEGVRAAITAMTLPVDAGSK